MTKYKTIFAADIKPIKLSEEQRNEAKASLSDLTDLLPFYENPEKEPDLLYIVANLAVGGMVNRNGDALDVDTALNVYKKFEKKQCNIEHNRKMIVGYILKAGLSEFGTDKLISEEEARSSGKPFNITTVAVLWRVASDSLCDYIIESFETGEGQLSLSFEVGFDNYRIIGLPKNSSIVKEQMFSVSENDPRFAQYDSCLIGNGGSGIKDGAVLARQLLNVLPLGQGIVANPAAQVKGIMPIQTSIEQPTPVEAEVKPIAPPVEQADPVVDTHINTDLNVPATNDPQLQSMPDMPIINMASKEEFSSNLSRLNDIYDKLVKINKNGV